MKRYFWLCVPLAIALLWIAGRYHPAAVFYDELGAWLSGGALASVTLRLKDKRDATTLVPNLALVGRDGENSFT